MKVSFKIFLIVLLVSFISYSSSTAQNNLGSWTTLAVKNTIKGDFSWQSLAHVRTDAAFYDFREIMLQGIISYEIDNKNDVAIGYTTTLASIETSSNETGLRNVEHRLHQAFTTKHNIDRVNLIHRYMLEQRFFKDDFKLRLRYMLDVKVPFNNKELADKTVFSVLNNELFLNTKNDIFNSNRFYVGFGYKLNSKFEFDIGYLHIAQSTFRNNNINTRVFLKF